MNLADRPNSNANRNMPALVSSDSSSRFNYLELTAADLNSELNLALDSGAVTTPTPPPTTNSLMAACVNSPPPNCPPPPPPAQNNQMLNSATDDEKQRSQAEEEDERPESRKETSVSVPNLAASINPESSAVSLLETFAAVARRRASGATSSSTATTNANNSRNTANSLTSGVFGRGLATNSVSSLVRLALSSNFPSGLLNQAQSYPSLNPAQNNGQPRQTNEAEQVSMEEFLESCRATSLLAELEDDEELPDADEEENEEDCDDSEDCEDNYDEEGLS